MIKSILKIAKFLGVVAVEALAIKFYGDIRHAKGFADGETTTIELTKALEARYPGISSEVFGEYIKQTENEEDFSKVNRQAYEQIFNNFCSKSIVWTNAMVSLVTLNKEHLKKYENDIDLSTSITAIHQRILRNRYQKYGLGLGISDSTGILALTAEACEINLDPEILSTIAAEYNVVYLGVFPIEGKKCYIFDGYENNMQKFTEEFWTNYNLKAWEINAPGLPIGVYTPDRINEN